MCKKLVYFIQDKIAPLVFILSLLLTVVLTIVGVKFYNLDNHEEVILFFVFTFLFIIFIFLLLAKIYKLSQETVKSNIFKEEEKEEEDV